MNKVQKDVKKKHKKLSNFYKKHKLNIYVDHSDATSFSIHVAVLEKKIFKVGYCLGLILPRPGSIPDPIRTINTNLVEDVEYLLPV